MKALFTSLWTDPHAAFGLLMLLGSIAMLIWTKQFTPEAVATLIASVTGGSVSLLYAKSPKTVKAEQAAKDAATPPA